MKLEISPTEFVEVTQDTDPISPADWDNIGEIVYSNSSRYTLGTKAVSQDTLKDIARQIAIGTLIGLPVYAYIHGDVKIRAADSNPFSCPWDSGQSGFVYAPREQVFREYGGKRLTKRIREAAKNLLRQEVETFSQYLEGDVWVITHWKDGEVEDCCGGYYGYDYAVQVAKALAAQVKDQTTELEPA